EALLWQALRNRQLRGRKFRRQHLIGSFIVDFYCADERLVVEVDGLIHEFQRDADRRRQQLLEAAGLRVLRIDTAEVESNLHAVLDTMRAEFAQNETPLSRRRERGQG
ncbi:MAG: endonuclease domain-containing protein, partial [Dehalococcoidia bacterium]